MSICSIIVLPNSLCRTLGIEFRVLCVLSMCWITKLVLMLISFYLKLFSHSVDVLPLRIHLPNTKWNCSGNTWAYFHGDTCFNSQINIKECQWPDLLVTVCGTYKEPWNCLPMWLYYSFPPIITLILKDIFIWKHRSTVFPFAHRNLSAFCLPFRSEFRSHSYY